jgi:hypothetical protein
MPLCSMESSHSATSTDTQSSVPRAPSASPAYVSMRQHTSAYVSIRLHTSAYVRIRQHTSAYVSIRAQTPGHPPPRARPPHRLPAGGSIRIFVLAKQVNQQVKYLAGCDDPIPPKHSIYTKLWSSPSISPIYLKLWEGFCRLPSPAYVSIRQHTSAYGSICQHT